MALQALVRLSPRGLKCALPQSVVENVLYVCTFKPPEFISSELEVGVSSNPIERMDSETPLATWSPLRTSIVVAATEASL